MSVTYFEISYPNFVLGAIIDPEEANQNNYDITVKVNSIIELLNLNESNISKLTTTKADLVYVNSVRDNLAGVGRTTETIKQNAANLISHKSSNDHDYKYYIKSEVDGKINTVNSNIDSKISVVNTNHNNLANAFSTHKTSSDHDSRYYNKTLLNAGQLDSRYYTKEELVPWLRGGDTTIREDVFIIVNPNLGDGTFTYTHKGIEKIGTISDTGGQIFTLVSGYYEPGTNRIEAMVNDTLRRSVASGGLAEPSSTTIELTSPEGSGAELTFKYYERLGMTAEYNIKMGVGKPPQNDGKTMWFQVIG